MKLKATSKFLKSFWKPRSTRNVSLDAIGTLIWKRLKADTELRERGFLSNDTSLKKSGDDLA